MCVCTRNAREYRRVSVDPTPVASLRQTCKAALCQTTLAQDALSAAWCVHLVEPEDHSNPVSSGVGGIGGGPAGEGAGQVLPLMMLVLILLPVLVPVLVVVLLPLLVMLCARLHYTIATCISS